MTVYRYRPKVPEPPQGEEERCNDDECPRPGAEAARACLFDRLQRSIAENA